MDMYRTGSHLMTVEMERCIVDCTECHQICLASIIHCVNMGGEHASSDHLRLLLDCAQICRTSADYIPRGSDLQERVCELCAEVCERCAESCQRLVGHDRKLRECAGICRVCAESCRNLTHMAA